MKSPSIKDILVIQLAKMGDFLQTTPLLCSIRRKYPSVNLTVLTDTQCVEVASGVPLIDEIIPLDLRSIHQKINDSQCSIYEKYSYLAQQLSPFNRRHFDIVYNINFSRITALLCEFFKGSKIVGYRLQSRTQKLIGKSWTSFIFHLMRYRTMMRINLIDLWASYEKADHTLCPGVFFDIDTGEKTSMEFPSSEDRERKVIGLQMGCGGRLRQWPTEYFADVAHKLVQTLRGRIVLLGSKGEHPLGRRFKDEWYRLTGERPSSNEVVDLIGKTNISQLASALKRCQLLVTGDTGTMHMATAMGTRVLALFMATALCHQTGPYGEGHYVLQAHMPCSPCNDDGLCQEPLCRSLIHPDMVYALASHILAENRRAGWRDLIAGIGRSWDSGGYVQVYQTQMDDWGVKFLPLIKKELGVREIMAVAYREVGRKLMRPAYQIDPKGVINELSSYYGDVEKDTQKKTSLILAHLSTLCSICELGAKASPHISHSDVEISIRESSGSLDVLIPLYGYFRDLITDMESRTERSNSTVTQKACKSMLIPVKHLFHLIDEIGSALPRMTDPSVLSFDRHGIVEDRRTTTTGQR